jgi:hypothetical protein
VPWLALAVFLLAIGLSLYATRRGPQVGSDSVTYLSGASNIRAGAGYRLNAVGAFNDASSERV